MSGGINYRFPKNPLCIYCQIRPGTTEDHVFSRAFFGAVQPEFAMKVPACRECNNGKGDGTNREMCKDEEYVRTIFTAAGQQHPTAARLIKGEITRSFIRSSSLLNDFKQKMVTLNAVTPSGIVVPNVSAMKLNPQDRERINRVLTKIVKGLCYTMSEVTWPDPCPLPPNWRVVIEQIDKPKFIELNQRFDQCDRNMKWTDMGSEQAIRFRGASEAKDSHFWLWLLHFYDALGFFAYTEPIKETAT